MRSLDSLLASGLAVRVAAVPAPHDPDSFIKQFGGPAFAQLIEKAQGFFDFYLDRLCATNDVTADRGRRAIVNEMATAVHKTGNGVLLDTYAQKTAMRLNVAAQAVRDEFKKSPKAQVVEAEEAVEETVPDMVRPPQSELWLLRFLLETDEYVPWIGAHLEVEWLTHPAVKEIVARRLEAQATGAWTALAPWLSELNNLQWQNLITEILADNRSNPTENNLKGAIGRDGIIKLFRDRYIDRRLASITQVLSSSDLKEEDQIELSTQMSQLRQLKKQPLTPKPEEGEA